MSIKENGGSSERHRTVGSWRHPSQDGSTDDLYENELDDNTSTQSLGYRPAAPDADADADADAGADDDEEDEEDGTVVTEGGRAFQKLAWEETEAVNCAKIAMALVLVVMAALCAVSIFFYARRKDQEEFEDQFVDYAQQIALAAKNNFERIHGTFDSWAVQITTTAMALGQTWPNVTHPFFEVHAYKAMQESGATATGLAPWVANRTMWESYAQQNQQWLQDAASMPEGLTSGESLAFSPYIFRGQPYDGPALDPLFGDIWAPVWQVTPVQPYHTIINYDLFGCPFMPNVTHQMLKFGQSIVSGQFNISSVPPLKLVDDPEPSAATSSPWSLLLVPVYDGIQSTQASASTSTNASTNVVATLFARIGWENFLSKSIPPSTNESVFVVLQNSCTNDASTFLLLNSTTAEFRGWGARHDRKYDSKQFAFNLSVNGETDDGTPTTICFNSLTVYPTESFEDMYMTTEPMWLLIITLGIFVVAIVMFCVYDSHVQKRQDTLMTSAKRSNAIVTNLFPHTVRERLMDDALSLEAETAPPPPQRRPSLTFGGITAGFPSASAASNRNDGSSVNSTSGGGDKPIADLFPNVTVLFGDIAGFTAWASVREPSQVFVLLEGIYNTFDKIARRRRIFKVETIGDCYMAAAGLPVSREDHALAMAKFARRCMLSMRQVVQDLEATLGPDTAELGMRIGMHSGPVTAGVLRGEKSRFQLFGDTVNTASRMESTGAKDKIQLSEQTAASIKAFGKEKWIKARDEMVEVKGKGKMQTYWLVSTSGGRSSSNNVACGVDVISDDEGSETSGAFHVEQEKNDRLMEWHVDLLESFLKKIVAKRCNAAIGDNEILLSDTLHESLKSVDENDDVANNSDKRLGRNSSGTGTDSGAGRAEIEKRNSSGFKISPSQVKLDYHVLSQLRVYVSTIASMYPDNYFHCFDHASHVTQAANKLLAGLLTQSERRKQSRDPKLDHKENQKTAAAGTWTALSAMNAADGIASDPLVQFAIVFSALIHDIEHPGVTNAQIAKEQQELQHSQPQPRTQQDRQEPQQHEKQQRQEQDVHDDDTAMNRLVGSSHHYTYNKTLAEQNSVKIAWSVLMAPEFSSLRGCICSSSLQELDRFHQLVETIVMATSIVDHALDNCLNDKWLDSSILIERTTVNHGQERAQVTSTAVTYPFHQQYNGAGMTLILEHIIQVSDVAHAMQHWHVYIKWHELYFQECYNAFLRGRIGTDPAKGWYRAELGFFDHYIIPLAREATEFNSFGVGSSEYLTYAYSNRSEWEKKGQELVAEFVKSCQADFEAVSFADASISEYENDNGIENGNVLIMNHDSYTETDGFYDHGHVDVDIDASSTDVAAPAQPAYTEMNFLVDLAG